MKLPNLFNLSKKPLSLSPNQKKRLVTKVQKSVKNLPPKWKVRIFHRQVIKLTARRKARMAMTHLRILGPLKRRKIIKLVDAFVDAQNDLSLKFDGVKLKVEFQKEQHIFDKQVKEILGEQSISFLETFEQIKD
ncbi:MAG: hypothetical protein WC915_01395 [archaeon]|jgi:hypothetical protein